MRTKAIFVAMLLALAPLPSFAQNYDLGLNAFDNGDYATALREFTLLADQGDAFAQFRLGSMYYNGQGVPQDYAEAVRWSRLEPIKATLMRKLGLASCITSVGASRRTTFWRICGPISLLQMEMSLQLKPARKSKKKLHQPTYPRHSGAHVFV